MRRRRTRPRRRWPVSQPVSSSTLRCSTAGARQGEGEGGPHADRALDADLAMHGASQIAADGEAESSTLVGARAARLELHERLEDTIELVRGDADAGVGDVQPNEVLLYVATHRDPALGLTELDGIREQVEQDLTDLLGVRVDADIGR